MASAATVAAIANSNSSTPACSSRRSQRNLRHRGSLRPTQLPWFVSCPREQFTHPRPDLGHDSSVLRHLPDRGQAADATSAAIVWLTGCLGPRGRLGGQHLRASRPDGSQARRMRAWGRAKPPDAHWSFALGSHPPRALAAPCQAAEIATTPPQNASQLALGCP